MNKNTIVLKDEEKELPIPIQWRDTLSEVVRSFSEGDFDLSRGVPLVEDVSEETVNHIRDYVKSYGEVLTSLPKETWDTSIYLWMGNQWDLIVDLWTEGEGRSDMVLSVTVRESNGEYNFSINMVYVP